jgi:prophage maintenance system killer protein
MIILTVDEIITLHAKLIAATGGSDGLRLNDVAISHTQTELVALGLGTADRSLDYEAVLAWVRMHLSARNRK